MAKRTKARTKTKGETRKIHPGQVPVYLLVLALPLFHIPGQTDLYGIPKWALLATLSSLALGVWLADRISGGFLRVRIDMLTASILCFLGVSAVSWLVTPYRYDGARWLIRLLFLTILYFATRSLFSTFRDQKRLLIWAMVGLGTTSLIGVLQYTGALSVAWRDMPWEAELGRRVYSTIGNPNFLAAYQLVVLPAAIAILLFSSSVVEALAAGAVVAVGYACLLFTNSWGGWSGFLASVIYLGAALKRRAVPVHWQRALVVLLVCLAITAPFFLTKRTAALGHGTGMVARLLLWRSAFDMIRERPLTGFGPSNYFVYSRSYIRDRALDPRYDTIWINNPEFLDRNPGRVHSEYLNMLVDSGIWGLLALGFVALAFFWSLRTRLAMESRSEEKALAIGIGAGVLAMLVHAIVDFPLHMAAAGGLTFLVLGLGAAPLGPGGLTFRLPAWCRRPLAAATVLAAIALSLWAWRPVIADRYCARGTRLKAEGDFSAATVAFERSAHLHVVSPEVFFLLGDSYYQEGLIEKALEAYRKAQELQPFHQRTHYGLGSFYEELGDTEKAIEHYQTALSLEPRFSLAASRLAQLLSRNGRTSDGLELLHRTLELRPDDPGLINTLGIVLAETGEWDEAKIQFSRSGSLIPENTIAKHNLYIATRDRDKDQLIGASEFSDIDRLLRRGSHRMTNGELRAALATFDSVLARFPHYVPAITNRGVAYFRMGDREHAIQLLHHALSIDPEHRMTQINLRAMGGDLP
jgi:tetratricopeptide (TPR) repeat protein/O-antigen ligase